MKVSLNRFLKNVEAYDFSDKEIKLRLSEINENKIIHGTISDVGIIYLPYYNEIEDNWSYFKEDDKHYCNSFYLNIFDNGMISFQEEDPDFSPYYYFYSVDEFAEFVNILPSIKDSSILNEPYVFKEHKFNDIIELYISISSEKDEIKFISIDSFLKIIPKEKAERIFNDIFTNSYDFFYERDSWVSFCEENNLISEKDIIPLNKMPLLFNNRLLTNCEPTIDNMLPYLGFKICNDYSLQYIFDYINSSANGKDFLTKLKNNLTNKGVLNTLTLTLPDDFIAQIKYSIEFRSQFELYKSEVINQSIHNTLPIMEIKSIYVINRNKI